MFPYLGGLEKRMTKVVAILMVRNEGHILERCVESLRGLADLFFVVDTGSDDDTVDKARAMGCVVREHPWKDFGHNRTLSFQEAFGYGPGWALVIDAAMKLVVDAPRLRELLEDCGDAGLTMVQKHGNLEYRNVRLMNLSDDWRCKGVTHEYWTCRHGTVGEVPKDIAYIDDIGDGGCKADKFERDERLLGEGLRDEPENERYYFYMANTLACQGKIAEAREYYKQRIGAGGWQEEIWYSMYQLAKLAPDHIEAEAWVQRALAVTDRAEALLWLVEVLRGKGQYLKAWHYLQLAAAMAPGENRLVLEADAPERARFERSVLHYYVSPDRDEGMRICLGALDGPYEAQVRNNMRFYARQLRCETVKISAPAPPGFVTSSIAVNEHGMANIRCVDYRILPDGSYDLAGGKATTRNFLSHYTFHSRRFLGMSEVVPQEPKTRDSAICGLEDIRLCGTTFTATQQEWSWCDRNRMVVGSYPDLRFTAIRAPTERPCEKNWLPLPDGDILYEWSPLTVCGLEEGALVVRTTHSTPAWWQHLRGSAPPFRVGSRTLALAHLVSESHPRSYLSVLLELEPTTWRPRAASLPFYFFGEIEYVLAAQCVRDEVHFFVSHWDRESFVVVVPSFSLPEMEPIGPSRQPCRCLSPF